MTVGVLLLSHGAIGGELLGAARAVMGPLSLTARAVGLDMSGGAAAFVIAAGQALRALDSGQGVLVLTDLYGATPSNVVESLRNEGVELRRVSGLNLPMLLRVFNYAEQELDELARTAAAGARNGVIEGHA